MFKAIMISKEETEQHVALTNIVKDQLPEGDVTIRVNCSTLNYKDALAITGRGAVVRRFPMVPGIDLAGVVEQSDHPEFGIGDTEVLNGWGVGEFHGGGLSEYASVKGDWLIPLSPSFSPEQAMSTGTAGYTAMLCLMALEKYGVTAASGEVLVTGAAGGVGSVAVAILANLGYTVIAMTGRPAESDYLKSLGASQIVDRADYCAPGKPLAKEQWAGAIDVAGGQVLANVCASMKYRGVVAACGLAAGMAFPATVAPFILRGVTLAGIDSVMCSKAERVQAWRRLACDLDPAKLMTMVQRVPLTDVVSAAEQLIAGQVRGRLIIPILTTHHHTGASA